MARATSGTRKKAAKRGKARASGRREKISPRGDMRFVRRSSKGRFKESDDAGRSFRVDRRKKSRTKVASGYGDRGDR